MSRDSYYEWPEDVVRSMIALKDGYDGDGLRASGGRSFQAVADRLTEMYPEAVFTKDMVNKRYNLTRLPRFSDAVAPIATPYLSRYFDANGKPMVKARKSMLGEYLTALRESGKVVKTLILSDQQGVFCDEGLMDKACAQHPDADIIVLPGDLADWEGASKYMHERDYPLMLEADWVVKVYATLQEMYPGKPIIVTDSNHRRRVARQVRSIPQGLLFLVEHNPERHLAQPFANVFATDQWWVQIDDIIYAHKEGKTALPGGNARDAIETFRTWEDVGMYGVQPFRVVVTGHSHKLAEVMYEGRKGIEPGMLAKNPLPYVTKADMASIHTNGYSVCLQQHGHAILNECRALSLA